MAKSSGVTKGAGVTGRSAASQDRQIPVVEASVLPDMIIAGTYDWRAALDEVREQYGFFRLGDDPTIWFTRYDAARDLAVDWELFSSRKPEGSPYYVIPADEDPPKAVKFRRAMMPMYSHAMVTRWEPRMRERARELVATFAKRGEADFVSEFAEQYFPHIAAEWIGVPPDQSGELAHLNHDVFKLPIDAESVGAPMSPDHKSRLAQDHLANIVAYCSALIDRKRAEPDDSLASFVVTMEVDGQPISRRDQVALVVMACLATGHTVGSHLAYVFHHLASHPDDRQAILDDPTVIDRFGEEMLRLYTFGGPTRIATRDAEFHGCPIRKGDAVMALFSQSNRDPRNGFDSCARLDRTPNRHLGWQVGVHQCAGMHFARAARRIAIEEWHSAIPEYHIDSAKPFVEQLHGGVGYRSLPLAWAT